MTWATITFAFLVTGTAVVILAWIRIKREKLGLSDFREYVRNPKNRNRVNQAFAELDATAARLATTQPDQLVNFLLDPAQYFHAKRAIALAGREIVPSLMRALADPRFRKPTDPKQQERTHLLLRRTQPLETVLECLERYPSPDAVPAVEPFVHDPNKELRKQAALTLGSWGLEAGVPALCEALADAEPYVRSYAIMGILRAIEGGRATQGFPSGVFDAVAMLVFEKDPTTGGDAPACLLRLDRERALLVLTDAANLVAGREGLSDVLRALRKARIRLDETQILRLADDLEPMGDNYPHNRAFGEALRLLAQNDSDAARSRISHALESASKVIREAAAEALAAFHGIYDPYRYAFDQLKACGWSQLTPPQRHVLGVRTLADEVSNGGFAQYIVNSSGDNWEDALEGLRAIGATEDWAIFQEILAMFDSGGPSTDANRRHHQLARVVQGNDAIFHPLEQRFYQDSNDREVLLMQYVVKYPAAFGAPQSPQE